MVALGGVAAGPPLSRNPLGGGPSSARRRVEASLGGLGSCAPGGVHGQRCSSGSTRGPVASRTASERGAPLVCALPLRAHAWSARLAAGGSRFDAHCRHPLEGRRSRRRHSARRARSRCIRWVVRLRQPMPASSWGCGWWLCSRRACRLWCRRPHRRAVSGEFAVTSCGRRLTRACSGGLFGRRSCRAS